MTLSIARPLALSPFSRYSYPKGQSQMTGPYTFRIRIRIRGRTSYPMDRYRSNRNTCLSFRAYGSGAPVEFRPPSYVPPGCHRGTAGEAPAPHQVPSSPTPHEPPQSQRTAPYTVRIRIRIRGPDLPSHAECLHLPQMNGTELTLGASKTVRIRSVYDPYNRLPFASNEQDRTSPSESVRIMVPPTLRLRPLSRLPVSQGVLLWSDTEW